MKWTKAALWPEPMSLDAPASKAEDAPTMGEMLPDRGPSPETLAIEADRAEYAHGLVSTLPRREGAIVTLRFGLAWPHREWTLDQIGMLAALSRERIRQLERAALARLRGELRAQEHPGMARSWAPPSVDALDRLAALDEVLERDDLADEDRRAFAAERGRLRSRVAS